LQSRFAKLIDQQSIEADQEKRRQLVWEIDRRLQEDQARPIVYHLRFANLLAEPGQGPKDDGEQRLQRLAL